jgi:thermitase
LTPRRGDVDRSSIVRYNFFIAVPFTLSFFIEKEELSMRKCVLPVIVVCFIFVLCASVAAVTADETRVWVGGREGDALRQAKRIVIEEYDGVLLRDLQEIGFASFRIEREDLLRILSDDNLLGCVPVVKEIGKGSIPEGEIPYMIENGPDTFSDYTPNDPSYNLQWGPECISAPRAWELFRGDMTAMISILDTGCDLDHGDLAAHMNTRDDYDFVNEDNQADDDHGHGTHCAGIAAGIIDNSVGIAGIAQAWILPVKVLDQNGSGWWDDIAAGILWARDHGAHVISMSLGGSDGDPGLKAACEDAYNSGVLIFAAAGNSGPFWFPSYPAYWTCCIGVGALGGLFWPDCKHLAFFSQRGFGDDKTEGNVEIVAPGVQIYSCYKNNGYTYMDGTSMACPHAAGVGALYCMVRPHWTNVQIRHHIQTHADADGGTQFGWGYGRIDMWPFAD